VYTVPNNYLFVNDSSNYIILAIIFSTNI
jgi:hypothetical protein